MARKGRAVPSVEVAEKFTTGEAPCDAARRMNTEQMQGLVEASAPLVATYAVRALGVLLLLWIAFRIAKWAGGKVRHSLEERNFDKALSRFFGSVVRWGINLGAVLSCLSIFGVETTSFAAVIGAAGLAVGLAFQGTLGNFAAGIMLLVFRPFDIGDFVKAGGQAGIVQEIGLFTIAIDTLDHRRVILPNSDVAGKVIENVTFHDIRRCDVDVGVAYDSDLNVARKALEAAVDKVNTKIDERPHQVFLAGLGGSSIDWQVRIWCKTSEYWTCHEETVQAIKESLDEAGVGIPFPNLEVHFLNELQTKAA